MKPVLSLGSICRRARRATERIASSTSSATLASTAGRQKLNGAFTMSSEVQRTRRLAASSLCLHAPFSPTAPNHSLASMTRYRAPPPPPRAPYRLAGLFHSLPERCRVHQVPCACADAGTLARVDAFGHTCVPHQLACPSHGAPHDAACFSITAPMAAPCRAACRMPRAARAARAARRTHRAPHAQNAQNRTRKSRCAPRKNAQKRAKTRKTRRFCGALEMAPLVV